MTKWLLGDSKFIIRKLYSNQTRLKTLELFGETKKQELDSMTFSTDKGKDSTISSIEQAMINKKWKEQRRKQDQHKIKCLEKIQYL